MMVITTETITAQEEVTVDTMEGIEETMADLESKETSSITL